jgi:hypothetical protein
LGAIVHFVVVVAAKFQRKQEFDGSRKMRTSHGDNDGGWNGDEHGNSFEKVKESSLFGRKSAAEIGNKVDL